MGGAYQSHSVIAQGGPGHRASSRVTNQEENTVTSLPDLPHLSQRPDEMQLTLRPSTHLCTLISRAPNQGRQPRRTSFRHTEQNRRLLLRNVPGPNSATPPPLF